MIIAAKFDFGQKVRIDKGDVIGKVTGIACYGEAQRTSYEISWFSNGIHYNAWFLEWRLEIV